MVRIWKKGLIGIAVIIALGLIGWGSVGANSTLAARSLAARAGDAVLSEPNFAPNLPLMATATAPPNLVPAILNGNPVHVLYITRSEDTVLVRCYPGFEPALAVRMMGNNEQKEGTLTCVAPS